jgi:hypothetical protein
VRPLSRSRVVGHALKRLGPDVDLRRLEGVASTLWSHDIVPMSGATDADLLEALAEALRREITSAAAEQHGQRAARRRS